MFKRLKTKWFLSKVAAELKAQYDDQEFVNRVCYSEAAISMVEQWTKHPHFRKDKLAPFLTVCMLLDIAIESMSETDKQVSIPLLQVRLVQAYNNPPFYAQYSGILDMIKENLIKNCDVSEEALFSSASFY